MRFIPLLFGPAIIEIRERFDSPAFGQFYTNTTSITNWYKSLFSDLQPQEPAWTLVRYNDDVHLYDIGSEVRINWNTISPLFAGGSGKRPVRIING